MSAGADRGEPLDLDPPFLGRCIDGVTEFGFQPCEIATMHLPSTGLQAIFIFGALSCLALGVLLQAMVRWPE